MKVSLILEAIDRMTAPAKRAQDSVRRLAGGMRAAERQAHGFAGAAAAVQARTNAITAPARRAEQAVQRLTGGMRSAVTQSRATAHAVALVNAATARMPAIMARASAAGEAFRARGLRALEGGTILAARGVGKLIRGAMDMAKWGAVGAIAGGGALAGGLIGGVIRTGAQFEQYQAALEGTERSAAGAKKALTWVADFAARTPYAIDQVTDAFVMARQRGIDPMGGAFEALGNGAAANRKSIGDAIEMIADAQQGEFERTKEFGLTASVKGGMVQLRYLDLAGKNTVKLVKNNAADITKALVGVFDEKYPGAMVRQSRTLAGIWNNLGDSVQRFELAIARAGIFDRVKLGLQDILTWTDRVSQNGQMAAWAKRISDRLSDAWEWGQRFVRDTDWNNAAKNIGLVANAGWSLVRFLGRAVELTSQLDNKLRSIPKPPDWVMRLQTNFNAAMEGGGLGMGPGGVAGDLAYRTLFGSGSPVGKSAARPTRGVPLPTPQRERWERAIRAAPAAPRLSPGAAPSAWPKAPVQRNELRIRLEGPGASAARVTGMQAAPHTSISVDRRGRGMGGPG